MSSEQDQIIVRKEKPINIPIVTFLTILGFCITVTISAMQYKSQNDNNINVLQKDVALLSTQIKDEIKDREDKDKDLVNVIDKLDTKVNNYSADVLETQKEIVGMKKDITYIRLTIERFLEEDKD